MPRPGPTETAEARRIVDVPQILLIFFSTALGSAVNSIAGGGTLLTFPALVGLGIPGIVANATSTVALVPGSLGSAFGYRRELDGSRSWATRFALVSMAGGLVGALLLLATPPERFDRLVPWLVLGATALFIVQKPVQRLLGQHAPSADPALRPAPAPLLAFQFLVAVYGGYFGAGIGILMLAGLGFMGFRNIHRMNGLKAIGGTSANVVAAATFALTNLVSWRLAALMTAAAIIGGYGGALAAQRVSQQRVRYAIMTIGLASGLWLLVRG